MLSLSAKFGNFREDRNENNALAEWSNHLLFTDVGKSCYIVPNMFLFNQNSADLYPTVFKRGYIILE